MEPDKGETLEVAKPIRGAPVGSMNNFKHGLRYSLKNGRLPPDCRHIEIRVNLFRRQIEAAVLQAKSEITLADACSVQTVCRWERHACLAQRWLLKKYDELTTDQKLNFSREIAKASESRDRAIAALDLDRDTKADLFAQLYRQPLTVEPAEGVDCKVAQSETTPAESNTGCDGAKLQPEQAP